MPCVYLPGPAPAVTVANNNSVISKGAEWKINNFHTRYR